MFGQGRVGLQHISVPLRIVMSRISRTLPGSPARPRLVQVRMPLSCELRGIRKIRSGTTGRCPDSLSPPCPEGRGFARHYATCRPDDQPCISLFRTGPPSFGEGGVQWR
jgi:hypothetical protein